MKNTTEHYGCLTKVENLWCLEKLGIPNTCLLESFDIFPGYYSKVPDETKPRYVYIVAGEKYTLEQVTRITKEVKQAYPYPFDAAITELTMRGTTCNAVRITGISDYTYIKQLQETYRDKGLVLKKKVRDIENEEAVIKIRKFYNLNVVSENVFMDAKNPDIGYFTTSADLPWDQFAKNITLLRNNWTGHSFDAAKSFIYLNDEITDMIRIYSKGITPEFLQQIKDKYCSLTGLK